jgi:hypothetical protein
VYPPSLLKLVPLVHPIDARLAAELAQAGGTTLTELGIGVPAAAPQPPISPQLLADSVVCAAADALKATPEAVRLSVLASFRRARELRMTVDDVEQAMMFALGMSSEPPPAAKKGKG